MNMFLKTLFNRKSNQSYACDFEKSNPLGDGGERVDFIYSKTLHVDKLDMYQLNHFRRYEFALTHVLEGDVCGDFACGTGYGSIMLSERACKVVGADVNSKVISEIKGRYYECANVDFVNLDLLDLDFIDVFNVIVSFETIEHIDESNIYKLFNLFNRALKKNGRIIFSTPYMQKDSETARKLGFHKTFFINEATINRWLDSSGFAVSDMYYQNYESHYVVSELKNKECIICIAKKNS